MECVYIVSTVATFPTAKLSLSIYTWIIHHNFEQLGHLIYFFTFLLLHSPAEVMSSIDQPIQSKA